MSPVQFGGQAVGYARAVGRPRLDDGALNPKAVLRREQNRRAQAKTREHRRRSLADNAIITLKIVARGLAKCPEATPGASILVILTAVLNDARLGSLPPVYLSVLEHHGWRNGRFEGDINIRNLLAHICTEDADDRFTRVLYDIENRPATSEVTSILGAILDHEYKDLSERITVPLEANGWKDGAFQHPLDLSKLKIDCCVHEMSRAKM